MTEYEWNFLCLTVHGSAIDDATMSSLKQRNMEFNMKNCFLKNFSTRRLFLRLRTKNFLLCLNTKFPILHSVQVQVHQSLLADQIKIAGLGRGYIGLGDRAIFMDPNVGSLKITIKSWLVQQQLYLFTQF